LVVLSINALGTAAKYRSILGGAAEWKGPTWHITVLENTSTSFSKLRDAQIHWKPFVSGSLAWVEGEVPSLTESVETLCWPVS
jgi:hypothetical protein